MQNKPFIHNTPGSTVDSTLANDANFSLQITLSSMIISIHKEVLNG